MKIFSTYNFSCFLKLPFLALILSFGLAGCSSVTNALNPGNIYSDIFQNKSSRSDVLTADVENRTHSDFILRGGSLSRLPSLQTDEGITPQPSEPIEKKPLAAPPSNGEEAHTANNQTQKQQQPPAFPGLSGIVQ